VIIRLAINKYVKSNTTRDVSDATVRLIEHDMVARLPEGATHDIDTFRRARLYRVKVAEVLRKNEKWLQLVFKHYSVSGSKDVTVGGLDPLMGSDEWENFCHDVGIIDAEVTQREVRLCFIWSQTFVSDEIKRREKLINMTFVDFLEALCRLCCFKALPTPVQLRKAGVRTVKQFFDADAAGDIPTADKLAPLDYVAEETRREPLYPTLERLLSLIFDRFDDNGSGKITKEDLKGKGLGVARAREASSGLAKEAKRHG